MYIIKRFYDGEIVYFYNKKYIPRKNICINIFCETAHSCMKFSSYKSAEKQFKLIKNDLTNICISQFCPACKEEFTGHPAISRLDNKTEICSKCGTMEALKDFFKNNK